MTIRRRYCHNCRQEIPAGASWEKHGRLLYCTACATKINYDQRETAKIEDQFRDHTDDDPGMSEPELIDYYAESEWIECFECGQTWTSDYGKIGVDWCDQCGGPLMWMSQEIKERLSQTTGAEDEQ